MKRVRTLLKYVLWIIAFWALSNLLIYVGINSTYKHINYVDKNNNATAIQITEGSTSNTDKTAIDILKAEATLINGRITLAIKNTPSYNISNKYIKLDLYSDNNNHLGTRYIEIGNMGENDQKLQEIYFKIKKVKGYSINVVDYKGQDENLELEFKDAQLTKGQIIWGVLIILMIGG